MKVMKNKPCKCINPKNKLIIKNVVKKGNAEERPNANYGYYSENSDAKNRCFSFAGYPKAGKPLGFGDKVPNA